MPRHRPRKPVPSQRRPWRTILLSHQQSKRRRATPPIRPRLPICKPRRSRRRQRYARSRRPPLWFSESTPPRAGIPPLDADAAPEPATGDIPAKPTKPAEETAAAEEPESFGHFSSKSDVLLRFNPTTAVWSRLPAMAPLAKGDHLMAFPLFRPTITLGSGVTIRSDGAAAFDLTGWTDKGAPIVSVEFGRLQIRSPGKDGNSVVFKLGGHEVEVTLVDADSTAALDVARRVPPGQDPETGKPAPLTAEIYAAAGLVRVQDGDAPQEMQSPAHKVLLGNRADLPADGEMPKWVSFESPSDVDRGAMATLEPLLVADRPLALSLGELSTHRRREVRAGDPQQCLLGQLRDLHRSPHRHRRKRRSGPSILRSCDPQLLAIRTWQPRCVRRLRKESARPTRPVCIACCGAIAPRT